MTNFCHENVIVMNAGLSNEEVHYTGDAQVFATRDDARTSAQRLAGILGRTVKVYEFNPEEWSQ